MHYLRASLTLLLACNAQVRTGPDAVATTGAPPPTSPTPVPDAGGEPDDDDMGSTGGSSGGPDGSTTHPGLPPLPPPPPEQCTVPKGELDLVPCMSEPLVADDAFNPDEQWAWWGSEGDVMSTDIPLVANLTDDNDDGAIDLCDTPDVIVLASPDTYFEKEGHLHVLDGATGEEHFFMEQTVRVGSTPALGDLDGDGLVEIVAVTTSSELVMFEHDGSVAWARPLPFAHVAGSTPFALGIADLDADGSPEIFGDNLVADADGNLLFTAEDDDWSLAATAADLDDDGALEVIFGSSAYRSDGTAVYAGAPGGAGALVQVADLDGDGEPEVLTTSLGGISVIDADGAVLVSGAQPTSGGGAAPWLRPAAIHDFNGDGAPQIAMSSATFFSVFHFDPVAAEVLVDWSGDVFDDSGIAAGTGFDFLGDGVAEAMYADESTMFVYDGGNGTVLLETTRASRTLIEYPVVADIDNDAAAEIIVVSNEFVDAPKGTPLSPTVSVIRNVSDKWVPTRRVWNQHTYHVTNVREDGTIPAVEPKHWERNNTFRTNAQIMDGGICDPEG